MSVRRISRATKSDRDSKGHFKPGHRVRSPGRPRGSTRWDKHAHIVGEKIEDILRMLIRKALRGDVQAAKILVDKYFPAQTVAMAELQAQIDALKTTLQMDDDERDAA